jgi:hypothetical protein
MPVLSEEEQTARTCNTLKAVANIPRMYFLIGIAFNGPLSFTQLERDCGGYYSPATVKFHLDKLRGVSLVEKRKRLYHPTKNGRYMAEFLRAAAEADGSFLERFEFATNVLCYLRDEG